MNKIIEGDCLELLRGFQAESVDLIVTDPPYGYSFMGKDWDKAVPNVDVWKECLRVLKDGAFMFVMSAPRQDVLSQMIARLGMVGFETGFTSIYWAYASGFPKAMNISLAVDKQECKKQLKGKLGRESRKEEFQEAWKQFREVVGKEKVDIGIQSGSMHSGRDSEVVERDKTVATSPEAKALDGSYGGFQPKPAVEVIIVAMKPLSEKTFVDQALKNQHGISWLDDARIPYQSEDEFTKLQENLFANRTIRAGEVAKGYGLKPQGLIGSEQNAKGRFPANLLASDDVLNDGKVTKSEGGNTIRGDKDRELYNGKFGDFHMQGYGDSGSFSRYFDLDKWFEKTVENLPESVRKTFPFLITPKASKNERNKGLEKLPSVVKSGLPLRDGSGNHTENTFGDGSQSTRNTKTKNFHPTVKPLALMTYLITLGSRPKDLVLDPFVGSGTTCISAKMLGRRYIGIDNNPEYIQIANARLNSFQTLDDFSIVSK